MRYSIIKSWRLKRENGEFVDNDTNGI